MDVAVYPYGDVKVLEMVLLTTGGNSGFHEAQKRGYNSYVELDLIDRLSPVEG